jgi:hypothetical protein
MSWRGRAATERQAIRFADVVHSITLIIAAAHVLPAYVCGENSCATVTITITTLVDDSPTQQL